METKFNGNTPLQIAAQTVQPSSLAVLVRYGADIHIKKDYSNEGVLALVLDNWKLNWLERATECLEILINAGAEIEDGLKDKVIAICKEHNITKGPAGEAMDRMCELFGVERPKSIVHDGKSPITVTATDWRDQHEELWKMLVPRQGKCKTVQGETVRICGKINDEIFNQGGAHWDAEFRKMLNTLKKYYEMGTIPDEAEHQEALTLIKSIGKNSDGDDVLRLCEINIHWVLANPEPIELGEVNYKR